MKRQADPANPAPVARLLSHAAQLLRAGRPGEAVGALREAARLAPGNASILHDLGLACLECGLVGEAVGALRGAVAARPGYADAHLRLGIALEASGAFDAALESYQRASAVLPSLADARYRAGELLDSLGRSVEAGEAFRRAASCAPGTALGHVATARAELAAERLGAAEKALRRALAVEPDNAAALELLGNVLADCGRFEEAREVLLRAIARDWRRAGSYYDVVRCREVTAADAALMADMRAAVAMPGLEAVTRARVQLALGKAAADLEDHASAMRAFGTAASLRDAVAPFDLAAFEARVERMISRFEAVASGEGDGLPVLIVGLPRSGTTLVEQILSAHPAVCGGGELAFWNGRGRDWEQAGASAAGAGADYLRLLRGIGPKAARVTDKMPLNFQWLGLVLQAVPGATIIHCRRRSIDTALSIHQTHFNPRMPFPTGGAALVGYIRAYERLCAHWRRVLPAERFVEVQYEALTSAPEREIRRMVAACGLNWDEACLHPERNMRAIRTPSKWPARRPIYRADAEAWRAYAPWLGALGELVKATEG
jgi:tetratricopeptide (TPR) repeat protein